MAKDVPGTFKSIGILMKTIPFIIIAAFTMIACNNNPKENNNTVRSGQKATNTETNCYAYTVNRDTVFIQIQLDGNNVTGDLLYNLQEKDKNKGKLTGLMKGDTLFAEYTFLSEGIESVREVAFIKNGNDYKEGYGDMEEKNGKMVFKNSAGLNFDGIIILKPVKCK